MTHLRVVTGQGVSVVASAGACKSRKPDCSPASHSLQPATVAALLVPRKKRVLDGLGRP